MNLESFDLKKAISYYAALMMVAGAIKLKLFYSAFHLDILNYLDASEILLAFVGDLIFYGAVIFYVLLFQFLTESKKERDERGQAHTDIISETSLKKRIIKHFRYQFILFLLIILFAVILVICIIAKTHYSLFLTLLSVSIMLYVSSFIIFEYRRKYFIIYGTNLSPKVTNALVSIIMLATWMILTNYSNVSMIKEDKKYFGSTFIVAGETIRSDSTSYYIGKTNNYIFYYKENSESCVVYPMKDVSQLEIKIFTKDR